MKARTLRTEPEKRLRASRHPRNNLARFSGTLAKDDLAPIIAAQGDFSRIDENMWFNTGIRIARGESCSQNLFQGCPPRQNSPGCP